MKLPFSKMHGIGNDFVMVDAYDGANRSRADIARNHSVFLCDRKFGVGADGVIVVLPGRGGAEFEMVMYNPDGSEAEMCGNGIRCFAKFVYDRGYTQDKTQKVMTGRGILTTIATVEGGKVQSIQVDMGAPILARQDVPATLPGDPQSPIVSEILEVGSNIYRVTCVSMGNPHCIVFVDDVDAVPLAEIGPLFESHPLFPKRINTEFIQVVNSKEYKLRVWERGAAETLACGTGACASAVACALNGKTGRQVVGHLAGGDLMLDWTESGSVLMTGAAADVFNGEIELD